ncbi:MAG: hypothetical protein ABSB01_27150 [Streptosporangiaceae bacterium]
MTRPYTMANVAAEAAGLLEIAGWERSYPCWQARPAAGPADR